MSGSSDLTDEQQEWYERRFGVRYLSVQEQPFRPSRKVRRGRGSQADVELLHLQLKGQQTLREMTVTPL